MSRRIGAGGVLVSACVFGATTPLVKHFFSDLDPVMLAGFLNFGSALAVVGASLAWAIDTNLMGRVAGANAAQLVMWRGLLAGGFSIALSLCIGAQFPSGVRVLLAGGLGFLAYGFVMILFVIGLRHLGAGRAGAYFATAPFVGAAISICLGEKISLALVAAAVLMAGGVCTLLGERHGAGVARTTS